MAWMATGLVIGFVGALVGAGGGFLLMPVLLLAYRMPPPEAAGVSLVTVTAAALAGTITHAMRRQVDFSAGFSLALFAVPGAMAGARLAASAPLAAFSLAFGLLLALLGFWLIIWRAPARAPGWVPVRPRAAAVGMNTLAPLQAGMVLVGGLSGLFGIGGGVLMVPLLALTGRMDVHRAGATAQLIMLCTALAGVAAYAAGSAIPWGPAAALAVGAVLGAPLGAVASARIDARRLLQLLGLCLLAVGLRLALRRF